MRTEAKPEAMACRRMLPREFYAGAEYFSADLRMMRRWWLPVGRRGQIPAVGDYLAIRLLGEDLILTRVAPNRLVGLQNVCRHRAAKICDEGCGHSRGRLRCPYHGWTYDLEGALVAAPHMDGVAGFDAAEFGLGTIAVEDWNGFLFASFEPTRSLESVLAPLTPLVVNWHLDDLNIVASLEYDVRANWKLIVQNFSECYHCPLVHPQLNRLTPYRSAQNQLDEGAVVGGPMALSDHAETMSLDGRWAAKPLAALTAEQKRQVYYYSIFPAMFLSPHPDYVLVHSLQPSAVNRTIVTCQILAVDQDVDAAGMERGVGFWDQTNRQDWSMCERAQCGVENLGYRPGPYSNLESLLARFDDLYLQALSDAEMARS